MNAPTIHENIIGKPNPPRNPVAAGSNASIFSTAGEPTRFIKNKPVIIMRLIISLRQGFDKVSFMCNKMQTIEVRMAIKIHIKIEKPPREIVSLTGDEK